MEAEWADGSSTVIAPAWTASGRRQSWTIAIARPDTDRAAIGRGHQALGSEAAAGEGTASAFFEEAGWRQRRWMFGLAHHPPDRDL
jgi:hypothetical protein